MTPFPTTYGADHVPVEMLALVRRLVPLLLEGAHPMLEILREQFATSTVREVSFSGVGFFAEIDVALTARRTEPADISGGNAVLELSNTEHGGGCVLFVRDGALCTLEGYTHGENWPEDTQVLAITMVEPILT